ncbi:MAG: hypothetical protein ABIA63_14070 [bacterium]
MEKESKIDRFKRVAERRTRGILRDLRILGNCGNKGNYSYTPDQVRKIFSEVEQAVKEARVKFHLPRDKEFKL